MGGVLVLLGLFALVAGSSKSGVGSPAPVAGKLDARDLDPAVSDSPVAPRRSPRPRPVAPRSDVVLPLPVRVARGRARQAYSGEQGRAPVAPRTVSAAMIRLRARFPGRFLEGD